MLKNTLFIFASILLCISTQAFSQQGNQHSEHMAQDHANATDLSKRPRRPAFYAELEPLGTIEQDKPITFRLTIKKQKDEIAKHKDFKVVHGRRLHLMSVNKDLIDYQHIHPRPDDLDGEAIYEFELTPTQAGTYQLYADVLTAKDQTNYLLPVVFKVPGKQQQAVLAQNIAAGEMQIQSFGEELTFKASIEPSPIRAGENTMLNITVTQHGDPYRRLEPTMQAYAHLVGFSECLSTMIHAHPMGEKLTSSSQRGGPNLMFHLVFPTAGKYRMFLQVKSDGEDVFVPFDVNVM